MDKQEIVDNAYDLSINKYKEVEYVPVEYPPTDEIMAELDALEKEIIKTLAEVDELLKNDSDEKSNSQEDRDDEN